MSALNFDTLVNQTTQALDSGNPALAAEPLRNLLEMAPNDLQVQLLEGRYLFDKGDLSQALDAMSRAVERHGSHYLPYLNRANILWSLGDKPAAIEDMSRALDRVDAGAKTSILQHKVQMLLLEKRFDDATPLIVDLVETNPNNSTFKYDLGRLHLKNGRLNEAAPLLEAAYRSMPSNEAYLTAHGMAVAAKEGPRQALELIGDRAKASTNRRLCLNCAWYHEQLEEFAEADRLLSRLREHYPEDVGVAARVLRVRQSGDLTDREAALEAVIALTQHEPKQSGTYLWALFMDGRLEDVFNAKSDQINLIPWSSLVEMASHVIDQPIEPWPGAVLQDLKPASKPVLFAACDPGYFHKYAQGFYTSAQKNAPGCTAHVHVAVPEGSQFKPDFEPSTGACLSVEHIERGTKTFFASRRYTLLSQALAFHNQAIICLDIDSHINRDPAELIARYQDVDVMLYQRPGDYTISQQTLAGFSVVRPSQAGKAFAQIVKAYCDRFLSTGQERWFLDQVALFAASQVTPVLLGDIMIEPAPQTALDVRFFDSEAYVWAAKGDAQLDL